MDIRIKEKEPFISYEEQLKQARAIDLRDNSKTINLGNGYEKIIPINKNKRWQ